MQDTRTLFTRTAFLFLGLITALSFLTYFHNYSTPQAFFWDENYHVASAQKYLNGVFFMEQHPPLGKLLIAAGEKLLNANAKDDQFIGTDYARDPPEGFSFAGYRFFPALLGWLTAPILFCIFLLLTRTPLAAALFSFLYVFDNALIVHLRGAMLESPLLFFCALLILLFLLLIEWKKQPKHFRICSLLFGFALACIATTKLNGLVMVLLVPALIWKMMSRKGVMVSSSKGDIDFSISMKHCSTFLLLSFLGFLLTYVAVWQVHFSLGRSINPDLPDDGYYQASEQYKEILTQGRMLSPLSFPVMLRDSFAFVSHYNKGVPRLDLCKSDENGSPAFLWPVGARSINYRWETPDGTSYRYLYLQVNPVVWALGLLGVLLSASFLLASLLLPLKERLKNPVLLATFLGLYASYMLAMSRLSRVLYLYHYFLPLLFSFILLGLCALELHHKRKLMGLFVLGAAIFLSFQFYRPFTYYEPLTDKQFARRSLLEIWDLRCARCESRNPLVVPGK